MSQPRCLDEVVFQTPWFKILEQHPPGFDQPYYAISSVDFVIVVALNRQGQLLLVRQFRPAFGGFSLEPPAGHVEPGETPEAAARKELCEETGHEAGTMELLAVLSPSPARNTNKMWIYFAPDVHTAVQPAHSREVGVECVVHDGGVMALLKHPEFVASGGWTAMLAALARGKLVF